MKIITNFLKNRDSLKKDSKKIASSSFNFRELPKEKQEEIIKNGAKDFSKRFKSVMKELANG